MRKINPIPDFGRFLLDSGLLFEINRLVLHPRGMAMYVAEDEVKGEQSVQVRRWVGIDDDRQDPEGFCFNPEAFEAAVAKLTKYDKENRQVERNTARQARLGYVIQEKP